MGATGIKGLKTMDRDQTVNEFQNDVWDWVKECFGTNSALSVDQRNHRFLEECLELHQANGGGRLNALDLVEYVYNRPTGEPKQEIGGVMLTLSALCSVLGINLSHSSHLELERVKNPVVIDKIRSKDKSKPDNSSLPGDDLIDPKFSTTIDEIRLKLIHDTNCSDCNKVFPNYDQFLHHICSKNINWYCKPCDNSFNNRYDFESHACEMLPPKFKQSQNNKNLKVENTLKTIPVTSCHGCNKLFTNWDRLLQHDCMHYAGFDFREDVDQACWTCKGCGKTFNTTIEVNLHKCAKLDSNKTSEFKSANVNDVEVLTSCVKKLVKTLKYVNEKIDKLLDDKTTGL